MEMSSSNDSSSAFPDYSQDTLEPFSEEEGESRGQYENESFESYYSGEESEWPAGSEESENTRLPSSQNDEEEEPGFFDSTVAEKSLMQKWINLLKDDRPSTGLAEHASKLGNALIKPMEEASEEELDALQSFCAVKINQFGRWPSSALVNRGKHNNHEQGYTSEKVLMHSVNYTVPDQLANRLYLRNLQETMKQAAETQMHQPSQCPDCEKERAELAKEAFLRQKRTIMEQVLLQEKLEDLMYTQDSLVLIGMIHKSLPRPSENPRNIWRKLNARVPKA